jgi:hypothetical protein
VRKWVGDDTDRPRNYKTRMNKSSNRLYMLDQGTGENTIDYAWLGIPKRQTRLDSRL